MTKLELLDRARKIDLKAYTSWKKEKIETAIEKQKTDLLQRVGRAISNHESFEGSYFWSPPGGAGQRRRMEADNSWKTEIEFNGNEYTYQSDVSASCKNVYYSGSFRINGTVKNVRLFRKLQKEIGAI